MAWRSPDSMKEELPVRRVLKPVFIVCICLAALFSGAVVVRADIFIVSGSPIWSGQEPPSPDPPNEILSLRITGDAPKKGYIQAQCSWIGGGSLDTRLKYSYNNGSYTEIAEGPNQWSNICPVDGLFVINVNLAPFLLMNDLPGLYTGTVTFRYRPNAPGQSGLTYELGALNISIEIIGAGRVEITPDLVSLVNPGLPDLELRGQAQVKVISIFDWNLEISCIEDVSSGTAIIPPNQILVSTDQINWQSLTSDPGWTFVRSGTGTTTFTLYFKIDSFLPFEVGPYIGEIALRAVAGPSP